MKRSRFCSLFVVFDCTGTLHGTMMDIYANAKRLDKVLEIFQTYFLDQQDIIQYSILMKAYGNCNLANVSEQVLVTLLDEKYDIDIQNINVLFHTLINAWSISSAPDAVHRAFNAIKMMKEHPKCKENKIRPNATTYTTLLKCICTIAATRANKNLDKSNISFFAEEIITEMEMEQTYNPLDVADNISTDHAPPTLLAYTTAIKVCLHVHDYTRAQAILIRLENSDNATVPTKYYSELIHLCTSPGTAASAIQGEKFVSHMIHLSKMLHKPSLEPNERLYVKIIDTWMKSNDMDSYNRVWNIYDKYLSNSAHFELTGRTYDLLIPYFGTASTGNYVDKADQILQRMENDFRQPRRKRRSEGDTEENCDDTTDEMLLPKRPNYRHYVPVIQGYLDGRDIENATKVLIQQVDMCVDEIDPIKKRSISPIRPIYLGIANGWIERGELEKASFIIETIQDLYDEGKICDGPCIRTYGALLQAYVYHPQSPHRHLQINRRGFYIKKYKLILNEMKRRSRKEKFDSMRTNHAEKGPSSLLLAPTFDET